MSHGTLLSMEPHLVPPPMLFSPELQRIAFAFSVNHFIRRSKSDTKVLTRKEWGVTVEEVLLRG